MIKIKRIGYLYEKICNRGNIRTAHKMASKGKRHYGEVKDVEKDLDNKLENIKKMLEEETYTLTEKDYTLEIINDKGKERELYKLEYYPHRIIQWSIMNVIMPIFMKNYSTKTYASLKGRGIHLAVKNIRKALRHEVENTQYCYKIDVKKFYSNINNKILMKKLERKFKDKKLLNLFRVIIFSLGNKGLPIGSLLSQYLANFYLSSFDHYCKEVLKLKNYYRYMDDIIVLESNKEKLHKINKKFHYILKNKFDLEIKDNWQIFPVDDRGIDFVGYRMFRDTTILRKRIYLKARYIFSRPFKHRAIPSYYGWCKHANVKQFMYKHNVFKKMGKQQGG